MQNEQNVQNVQNVEKMCQIGIFVQKCAKSAQEWKISNILQNFVKYLKMCKKCKIVQNVQG